MIDQGFDTSPRIFGNHRSLFRNEYPSGSIYCLGIEKSELYNKSVYDIGIGAGGSLYETAQHNAENPTQAIHYIGVDVLLQMPDKSLSENDKQIKEELRQAVEKFPSLFQNSNVIYGIPQPPNSFDYVISHYGMPEYTNNPTQVVNIIFEMVRVAKEKVVFTGGWLDEDFEDKLKAGEYIFGGAAAVGGFELFSFKLKKLMEELKSIDVHTHRHSLANVHLDTTHKDLKKLEELRKNILNRIEEFS